MTNRTQPADKVFENLLTPEQIEASNERSQKLIAEYASLQDLRKALGLTQVELAKRLGIAQKNVSGLEARDDILLSTLDNVIQSMGGELELRVNFPGRPPAILHTGLSEHTLGAE